MSNDPWTNAARRYAREHNLKPKEPTGMGAVVIDYDNREWVKADYDEAPWFQPQEKDWRNFDDLDAVEVKSPGVQL